MKHNFLHRDYITPHHCLSPYQLLMVGKINWEPIVSWATLVLPPEACQEGLEKQVVIFHHTAP